MGRKKDKAVVGRSLVKDRFGNKRRVGGGSFLHTSDLNDGYDWGRLNLQSVTDQNTLDEFLATAELAGTEFTAEKMNVAIVDGHLNTGLPSAEEMKEVEQVQDKHKELLRIPRRPTWNKEMTGEELDQKEKESFLEWRRKLAQLQEVDHIVMTPFEKNLEFWRQLWRVIERSDIVVQIVDARNPLMFRCMDLEKYVKEVDSGKTNVILINKADFLTASQREFWAEYFDKQKIHVAFWSAIEENERNKVKNATTSQESDEDAAEVYEDDEDESGYSDEDDDEEVEDNDETQKSSAHCNTPDNKVTESKPTVTEADAAQTTDNDAAQEASGPPVDSAAESGLPSHGNRGESSCKVSDASGSQNSASQCTACQQVQTESKENGASIEAAESCTSTSPVTESSGAESKMLSVQTEPSTSDSHQNDNTDNISSSKACDSTSDASVNINVQSTDAQVSMATGIVEHGTGQKDSICGSNIAGDVKNSPELLTGEELLQMLKNVHHGNQMHEEYVTVGMVGYPNVGKSSTINALLQMKKVPVSATPGRTKHFQTLFVDKDLLLCDCPGLVMPTFVTTKAHMIISGILPIDQMRDYVPPVSLICQHIPREHLDAAYGILLPNPAEGENPDRPPTAHELLAAYSYVRGFMTHKGIPDYQRSARCILKDYLNGKLLFCHTPPDVSTEQFQPAGEVIQRVKPMAPKASSGKSRYTSEVDKNFFDKMESRHGSKGVQGVVGFTRKAGFTRHHTAGEGAASVSSSVDSLSAKPWKRHNNKNKKEKLRRLHRDLDA